MDEKPDPTNERRLRPRESSVFWSLMSGLLIYQLFWGNMDILWFTTIAIGAAGFLSLINLRR